MRSLHLAASCKLRLDRDDGLFVAICDSTSIVEIPSGTQALICPVFGSASIFSGDMRIVLSKADVYVTDIQTDNTCIVSQKGPTLVFFGSAKAWSAKGSSAAGRHLLYPSLHKKSRLSRRLLTLARICMKGQVRSDADGLDHQLLELVGELQSDFQRYVLRCPGNKLITKQAVFLRLQRVRNYIEACAHRELEVKKLALIANYSVSHFITTFRTVFHETPYSNISRHRLENAESLLTDSELAIGDIAQAIGFPSRSSFSRAIRQAFGSSPTAVRSGVAIAEARPQRP